MEFDNSNLDGFDSRETKRAVMVVQKYQKNKEWQEKKMIELQK